MSSETNNNPSRGGRPRKAAGEQRDRRIVTWVNAREQARYLVNASRAGETGADFARAKLCFEPDAKVPNNDNQANEDFELIDALTRIGVDLQQLSPIILATGHIPDEFQRVLHQLDQLLGEVLPK